MTRDTLAASFLAAFLLLPTGGTDARDAEHRMPASRDRIAVTLVERGVVARDATPEQLDAAVDAYLASKAGADKAGGRLARKRIDGNEAALNGVASQAAVRGRKLGTAVSVPASTPAWKPLGAGGGWNGQAWVGRDRLLLVLVEFSPATMTWDLVDGSGAVIGTKTAAGPLHNEIAPPSNTYDLWRPDFEAQHYEDMLFAPGGWTIPVGKYAGEERASMRDYYLAQSYGKYTVEGRAYGWYQVGKPEAYYGDDDAAGNDQLPGTTWDLIRDAVQVINAPGNPNPIPWAEYDLDGNCTLDHVLFIHAGADQSAGGGAQGDDAIWAHSWDVSPPVKVADGAGACAAGYRISNYTIMPEDGGIGVFAHEFGHDLGLPDEYDTLYTGRGESVEKWSLMSSGSWTGAPAQTEPTGFSAWARYVLGWYGGDGDPAAENLAVVDLAQLGKDASGFRLEQAGFWAGPGTYNALRVNLPPRRIVNTAAHSGALAHWAGKADLEHNLLYRVVDLRGKTSASLSFWTWYDIEPGWDFGFLQVSEDGQTFSSLPLAGTTSAHDPDAMGAITAQLPGFTGRSGGWAQKTVDLTPMAGKRFYLAFRYMTDWGTTGGGWYVDDLALTVDGAVAFADDAETAAAGWGRAGSPAWSRTDGSVSYSRYYLAEMRNPGAFSVPDALAGATILNSDVGLRRSTQFDPLGSTGNPEDPWLYSYSPGVVLWLRDSYYEENWTRAHPGHGFLLVVDAHDHPVNRPSAANVAPGVGTYPFNTHVQIADAAFSLDRALDFRLGYWGSWKDYTGLNGVPVFDDALRYWSQRTPDASTFVPSLGLVLRVAGEAADDSAALVGVGRK